MLRVHSIRRPYCLTCYAPLESGASAAVTCGHCGEVNIRQDFARFWTREAWLRGAERFTKAAIVASRVSGSPSMGSHIGVKIAAG